MNKQFSFRQRILFTIILCSFAGLAFAQDLLPSQQLLNPAYARPAIANETKGEMTVDPAVYTIGPGDVLEVRCSKMPWVRYSGTVNEAGVLYIAEFGSMSVGKKSLSDAKSEIAAIVSKNCRGGEIDVTLASPKKVEVILVGEGLNCGSYRLDGTFRVLDAIKLALKDPSFLNMSINIRQVSVTIQRSTTTYDVAKFIAAGISAANPYLYPGSIISVAPGVQRASRHHSLQGE
jgi:protein involved in polysaccharide export with SLBB domain